MCIMEDSEALQVDDPVARASSMGAFTGVFGLPHDGVQITEVRSLLHEALGAGHRKKAGHWRNRHTRAIRAMLSERSQVLYSPRGEAALQSMIETGQMPPQPDRQPDLLAMLPGYHYVVVVDTRTDVGWDLINRSVELPLVVDTGLPADTIERVQRANAVDVVTIALWRLGWK